MSIQNKINLSGSLNTDDGLRNLPAGDYPDTLNSRIAVTEKSNDGSAENTRGNVLISNVLPAGTNQIIGSYEDKNKQRIIYFNWNSLGNHGIYQFFWNQGANGTIETIRVEPLLNFSRTKKITGISVVEALTGDLLYWTDDFNRPRKINIDKSNDTNKNRKFELFLKINNTITTTITSPSGVPFSWTIVDPGAGKSSYKLEDAIKFYMVNIPAGALALATFTSCYQFVTVEMKNTGAWDISVNGNIPVNYAIAQNFYPAPFKEEFIDAIKYPTECEPKVVAKQDPDRNINLIQNKIFQFRIRLIFDDNEKSVLSPYSRIADLPISCSASSTQSSFNYIEVDFNSARLLDPQILSIIKRVDVFVRERNEGKVKFITSLDKWQFLFANDTYSFYNDGIYQAIDPATELKNYDSLPLLSKSQEFGTNRIFYGGITEGYDPVCVDAKLNLTYKPNVVVKTYSFSGKIFIKNLFATDLSYINSQPIHDLQDGNGYVFGGFGKFDHVNTVGTDYKQKIPLGGFVAYLAGTNHYGISKQPTFKFGVIQDSNGVMNSATMGNPLQGCGGNNPTYRKRIRCNIEQGGVWSNFTIANVSPGKYILRIASHLTTQADLNGTSLNWQKTSTYTLKVAGAGGSAGKNEAIIEIKTNGDIWVDGVFTATANGSIPDTQIADITDPSVVVTSSIGMTGYVTDADITPTPATTAGLLGDTRIDLATVVIDYNFIFNGVNYTNFADSNAFTNKIVYTDHNGYFWWACRRNASAGAMKIQYINVVGVQPTFTGFEMTGGGFVPTNNKGTNDGLFRSPTSGLFDNVRTKLVGNVTLNGQPLTGINAITTRGQFDETDPNGDFNIVIYGDTKNFLSSGIKARTGQVFLVSASGCIITFGQNSVSYSIIFGTLFGQYNYTTTTYQVSGITIISVLGQSTEVALKRGGKYSFGLVYQDNAIRDNNVNTTELLNLKVPFYTEGAPIAGGAQPIVEMEINNNPPPWATHYQIVRTLNGNQGRYLQWTAKTVTYVDDDGNIVSFAQATQVKIDLESILCFNSDNVDSKVAYQFEEGDRLVLIKNGATGNFYNSYIDYKIKGFKTGASLILYIDNLVSTGQIPLGSLFEIYNPLKKPDVNIYYEIGECFEIGNAGTPQAFHSGNVQNQIAGGQPAKVLLTTGDTYYRTRVIPYDNTNTINSPCNTSAIWFIEDASVSDFYVSKDQSIGRIHIQNKDLGERHRPSAIRFSNVLIEETKVNGLNSFEGLNEKVLPLEYGLIQKLIMSKDTLCSIHNNSEFVTLYLGKDVLLDNALQSLVAVSNKVIQQSYQYQGGLGTQNPESIAIDEENVVYGYDNNKGMVWEKQVNGLLPISEIKMRTYFRDKSLLLSKNGGTFVYGAYDNRFGQYILSFEAIQGTPPGADPSRPVLQSVPADTIAYNNRKKGWESRYSFHPEYFGGARNNVLVSFKGGSLWRHNSSVYNNFYGTQFKQTIKVVANQFPSDMKIFLYTSTESSHRWGTTAQGIKTLEGQVSELNKTDFEFIEDVYRADILKDLNTPNVTTPIINGDDMRSSVLEMNLENDEIGYSAIYAVNIYSILSQSTNK